MFSIRLLQRGYSTRLLSETMATILCGWVRWPGSNESPHVSKLTLRTCGGPVKTLCLVSFFCPVVLGGFEVAFDGPTVRVDSRRASHANPGDLNDRGRGTLLDLFRMASVS